MTDARDELLRLATNHDRRGDHLDRRAYSGSPASSHTGRWGNLALRAARLKGAVFGRK
jgi:hypothetical protein